MSDFLSMDEAQALLDAPELNNDEAVGADLSDDELQEFSQDDPSELADDDEDAPETASGDEVGDDDGSEDDDTAEGPSGAAEVPEFWDAKAKDMFARLPGDLKAYVSEQTAKADEIIRTRLAEAAETRKVADSEAEAFGGARRQLEQHIELANLHFANRWAQFTEQTWDQLSIDDPVTYRQLKHSFQQDQHAMRQIMETKQASEQAALSQYHKEQHVAMAKLAETDATAKMLNDPIHRDANVQKLAEYLVQKQGVPADRLNLISANEMVIAYKAMRWDESQAKVKNGKTPAPAQKSAQTHTKMRNTSATGQTQASHSVGKQEKRFQQTLSQADALALMNMRSQKTSKPKR